MKNKKIKQFMKVLSVFAAVTVILLCTTLPAFAASSSDFITYKGSQFSEFKFVESISYEYGGKYKSIDNVTIPNTYNAQGNTKGQPFYADVRLATLKADTVVLQPGQTIQFHFRYWCNVVLSTTPDEWTFYYPGTDVQIYYAVNDSPLTLDYSAKPDTSYTASATLPFVLDVSFTNTTGTTMEFYGVRFGDIDGDNTWPGGIKRDTLKGYFNVNQFFYRIMTAEAAANDELINGWKPKPQKPSGSGTVESTNDLEHQISENAQAGIDQSNSLFGSFGDTLSILTSGMVFVTGLFNTMLGKMQFLESLAIIGLVLGIIGFILNLVPSIGSRLSRSDRDRERKEKERVRAEKKREKRIERKNYNNIGNRTRRR